MKRNSDNTICSKSYAGKLGSAARWENHVKIPSKLARVYQDDYDYISSYCRNANIPFVVGLHLLCTFVRHRHGFSAFGIGQRILESS